MKRAFLLLGFIPLCCYAVTAPLTEEPQKYQADQLDSFLKEKGKLRNAEEWYELSLIQIKAGHKNEALMSLDKALQDDPHFAAALIQRGFIHVWEKETLKALGDFFSALRVEPGNKAALAGFSLIALEWSKNPFKEKNALWLLRIIYR